MKPQTITLTREDLERALANAFDRGLRRGLQMWHTEPNYLDVKATARYARLAASRLRSAAARRIRR